MGKIVLHAGMAKAGSSSIRGWIERNARAIALECGVQVLVAARFPDHPERNGRLVPYAAGAVNSDVVNFLYAWTRDARHLDTFADELDAHAHRYATVLVTSEGFANLFAKQDPRWLGALNRLGRAHQMHVVLYVRPQHEWIESAWKQWGYRESGSPVAYLFENEPLLDYAGIQEAVRRRAPNVTFDLRPFHHELLAGGDVVVDFVTSVLELPWGAASEREVRAEQGWANRALPLELVNLLRYAEPGRFFDHRNDNGRLNRLKPYFAGLRVTDDHATALGRLVLQKRCRDVFERGNGAVIRALGWPLDHFVPPVPEPETVPGIEALDELWEPAASPAERELLYAALDRLLTLPGPALRHAPSGTASVTTATISSP